MIEQFHFLRPWWLLLLLPLGLLMWQVLRGRYDSGSWRAVVDARLLPHLLSGAEGARRNGMRWLLGAVAALAVVALAGPTWEKLPQPVYRKDTSLVILLDLSRSMNAADIKPSRLVRARHKIADILNLRIEGQTALVVYAADAFAVTPLTSDVDTILAMLPDLETELMPAQGSRADRAFELGLELLVNAGAERGDLLLVSDGVGDEVLQRVVALRGQNPDHRFSVLAVGTPEGGPVPLQNGGFLKTPDGSIVISELQEDNLRRVAHDGGGVYATISADDIDINTLAYLMESSIDSGETHRDEDRSVDSWRELGPWLLLVALPFASLAFRRGVIWLLPLCFAVLPPDAQALDWHSLWQNDDQRARELFAEGRHAEAAKLFDDPDWRASAQYRAGDFDSALDDWNRVDGEDALYNRGNALARLGRYDEALAAYDSLLERNPGHEDALFNKRSIEEFLRRQQQQQQSQSPQDQQRQQQEQQADGQNQAREESARSGPEAETGQEGAGEQQEQSANGSGSNEAGGDGNEDSAAQPAGESGSRPPMATGGSDDGDRSARAGENELQADEQMSAQAAEQWLRKIPDDPGGLLKRKFYYQYRQRGGVVDEAESW